MGRLQRAKPQEDTLAITSVAWGCHLLVPRFAGKAPHRRRQRSSASRLDTVPSMARCKYSKYQQEILDRNNYRFYPNFCASLDQFSFPLHGKKGTYLKMKFDILYKAQLKLGTATKMFMARNEIEIAEWAKLWSSVNFVCKVGLYKLCICLNTMDAQSASIVFTQTQGLRQAGSL